MPRKNQGPAQEKNQTNPDVSRNSEVELDINGTTNQTFVINEAFGSVYKAHLINRPITTHSGKCRQPKCKSSNVKIDFNGEFCTKLQDYLEQLREHYGQDVPKEKREFALKMVNKDSTNQLQAVHMEENSLHCCNGNFIVGFFGTFQTRNWLCYIIWNLPQLET